MCNRRRQKALCDTAESLFHADQVTNYAVITPHDDSEAGITRAKAALARMRGVQRGVWSVEAGSKLGGLHINAVWQGKPIKNMKNCVVYDAGAVRNIRAVIAYIIKSSQIPSVEQYSGRTIGTWGKFKEVARSAGIAPVINAASIEAELQSQDSATVPAARSQLKGGDLLAVLETPYEIAKRHLPNFRREVEKIRSGKYGDSPVRMHHINGRLNDTS